jgi:hypothetical protein
MLRDQLVSREAIFKLIRGCGRVSEVKKIQREYSDFSLNKNSLTLLVVNPRLVESNAVSYKGTDGWRM